MRKAFSLALGLACALVAVSSTAAPTAQLSYERGPGAETCPDDEGLRALIAARLGYDPIRPDGTILVRTSILRDGHRLRASIAVTGEGGQHGTRELTSAVGDCAELASSIALAVSIAVDPLVLTRPALPVVAFPVLPPPTPVAPPPSIEKAPALPAPAERTPSTPVRLRAGVGAVVSTGALPAPAFGGILTVGAGYGPVSLELEGRADARASTSGHAIKGIPSTGAVSASLLRVSFIPCFHVSLGFGCLLASVGELQGSSIGVDDSHPRTTTYFGFGGRLGAEYFFGRALGARVHADVLATPSSITLSLNGQPAWTTPIVSGSLGVDLVARYP